MRSVLFVSILCFIVSFASAGDSQNSKAISANSYFHVLVYSDGLLSGLGHDHVIAAHKWQGQYTINDSNNFLAQIQVDAKSLVVDRKTDRAMYPHLAKKEQPSDDDISATKKNMLGKDVLNARQYPTIKVRINGNIKTREMLVRITVAGHEAKAMADYKLVCDSGKTKVKGQFRIHHADLGLTPFSALFGAIRVAKPLVFHFMADTPENCSRKL